MRINNDLDRANSKRSKRSIEKKNVIFKEENNDYIEGKFLLLIYMIF